MKRTDSYLDRNYNFNVGGGLSVLGIIGLVIGVIFIAPWLSFWLAYFGGWVAKIVIGNYLVKGFALFGITMPIDKIPLAAGILGWIGGFFKNTIKLRNND